jgi:hypothetical protein
MPSDDDLRDEIYGYSDLDLVQVAWEEWADFDADERIKAQLGSDLREAERQITEHVVLSMQGRGRLRKFVFNKRRQDRRRGG